MIQQQTILNVSDNSGAKLVRCIKVLGGFKKKTAGIGDTIIVSVTKLRNNKSKGQSKVKKGEIYKALITKTKFKNTTINGFTIWFNTNSVILLTKQYKPIGSRILGPLPSSLKFGKSAKIVSTSYGLV